MREISIKWQTQIVCQLSDVTLNQLQKSNSTICIFFVDFPQQREMVYIVEYELAGVIGLIAKSIETLTNSYISRLYSKPHHLN